MCTATILAFLVGVGSLMGLRRYHKHVYSCCLVSVILLALTVISATYLFIEGVLHVFALR